jgi:hypothetical protein
VLFNVTMKIRTPNFARRNLLLAAAACPLALSGCGDLFQSPRPASEATGWNAEMVEAIRAGKLGPPMVSRAMGMVATSAFDAWAPYHSTAVATQAGGIARVEPSANTARAKTVSISFAMYRTLLDLLPHAKPAYDARMAALGLDPNNLAQDSSPEGIGNSAAARLIASRANDGSNQKSERGGAPYSDYTGYAPVNTVDKINDPTRWQPLKFSTGLAPGFMAPHWGNVKPFAMTDGASLRVARSLPAYGSAEYRDQAALIVDLTANLTPQQKMIAEYWANGPRTELPPGHWNLFAQSLAQERSIGLDAEVVLYFLQGNAVMDAGIACWDCKRFYDSMRPITAIRSLYAGQRIKSFGGTQVGIVEMAGEQWSPWQPDTFITPPFAEFTSGHSTFSTASAEVMKRFFGSDTFRGSQSFASGSSATEARVPDRQITLEWETFTDAANEAGNSRLYGGIHFTAGNDVGKSMGRQVGGLVWDKTQRLLAGNRS